MAELLFIESILKEPEPAGTFPWGQDEKGMSEKLVGECQATNGDTKEDYTVLSGEYAGKTIQMLWKDYPELFGNEDGSLGDAYMQSSIKVADASLSDTEEKQKVLESKAITKEHIVTGEYYTVERYQVHGTWQHNFRAPFTQASILEGQGTINGISIVKGQTFIVPAGYGVCQLDGDFSMICFWPNQPIEDAEEKDGKLRLTVADWRGRKKAQAESDEYAILTMEDIYEEGDYITVAVPETEQHYVIRIDDTIDESLVYMTANTLRYDIPFEEKKKSYNKKSFTGARHYLTCRKARDYEVNTYQNLARNVMDQHGNRGCYPHASANVETRGESVFAARNAIDGVVANHSHGSWPYESWGINQREDAEFLLEFGRLVDFDKVVLWTRADFPHDNWWVSAMLTFSDGTVESLSLEKSDMAHVFHIVKKNIRWMKLGKLVKAEDPSPFPALTQIEVYGTVAKEL